MANLKSTPAPQASGASRSFDLSRDGQRRQDQRTAVGGVATLQCEFQLAPRLAEAGIEKQSGTALL